MAWAWATVTVGVSAVLLFFVSFLMTTAFGTFAFQMFGAVLGSGWFIMRVKSPYAELRTDLRLELATASIEVEQATLEWRIRTSAVAQAFADKREAIRLLSLDYEGRLHGFRKEEADLAASRRPAAEREALRRRRAALLSSMEQSLVAGLDELRQFHLDSAQVAAAAENRFRFAVARRNDAATAMTALPFPKWAA
jgi:hypothetical protein